MLGKDLVHKCLNVEFDVLPGLDYIDTIVEVQVALSLDGFRQPLIDEIHEHVGRLFIGGSYCKVIDLSEEKDPIAVEYARIEARFMYSRR